jgi:hypothetical protein
MKRIVNGKRYDTDAATLVATDKGSDRGSFDYYEEELYRTRSGAWFVHGYGHARSRWATSAGQYSWAPGEGIEPMTPDDARTWLEGHGKTDALEQHFADQITDA